MDSIDLESIPNQIGTGIIRIENEFVLKVSGLIDREKLKAVYRIFKDSYKVVSAGNDLLKKITIDVDGQSFVVTTDGQNVYIVLIKRGRL